MGTMDTINIITEAVSQALAKMVFLEAAPFVKESEAPSVIITADIDFSGPVSGTIRMVAGVDFAQALAENISGMFDLTEEQCWDAVKELANVTCGLVLPMIASSEADVFDLTVPHLSKSEDRTGWDDFVSQDEVTVLNVEGYAVATRLILK